MMLSINETTNVDDNTIRSNTPQAPLYFILLGSWLSHRVGK